MMLKTNTTCLCSGNNKLVFQGVSIKGHCLSQSRSDDSFVSFSGGNLRNKRSVGWSSTSRSECSEPVSFSQSHQSYPNRQRRKNIVSALGGHSHGTSNSLTHGYSAVSDIPFLDRLKEAWRVLTGAPEKQNVKDRFSRLLIQDRGFSANNLSRLYNAARGAIMQHVELEDEDLQVKATVQRLGEVEFYFKVRRLKTDLLEETYSEEIDVDFQPQIESHLLWQETDADQNQDIIDESDVSSSVGLYRPGNLIDDSEGLEGFSPRGMSMRERWQRGASDRLNGAVVAKMSSLREHQEIPNVSS